jgi:cytochrome c-type biogenesis protein CcmE
MISKGRITEADGWIKIGKLNRFIADNVLARCRANLFAKGLDRDGHAVERKRSERKLRAVS